MTHKNGTRQTRRSPALGKVHLEWADATHGRRTLACRILDLSAHGMRIQMTDPIPAGSYIYLKSKEHALTGNAVVKHCRSAKAGYQIGLAFSGFEWKGSSAPDEQTRPV